MITDLLVYFTLGGIISALTYIAASRGGAVAALITIVPLFTALAFYTVYVQGGSNIMKEYAMGLIIYNFAWCAFVLAAGYVCWQWNNFWWAMAIGAVAFAISYGIIELGYRLW